MTAIAFKDGILAADTAEWSNGIVVGHVRKIERLKDGSLFAASGRADIIDAYLKWADGEGEKPERCEGDNDFHGLRAYLGEDGVRTLSDKTYDPIPHPNRIMAAGACTDFLMGAMLAGASAEEAVALAIKYHADCAGEVLAERLEPAPSG